MAAEGINAVPAADRLAHRLPEHRVQHRMGVLQIARRPNDRRLAVTDGWTWEKRGHFRHQALTERGTELEEIGQVLDEASGVGIGDNRNSGYARNRAIG